MRPGVLIALLFAALGLAAIALAAGFGWAVLNTGVGGKAENSLMLGGAILVLFLFALALAWAFVHLRLVRPIETLTREVQTLTHATKLRPIEAPPDHLMGALPDALQELVEKFIAARGKRQEAIDTALERGDAFKRRLETILLDLSEGVIVCNLDNRVLLYNQAASEILKQPESLGLGRRLFGLFEREAIIEALNELVAQQRADKTRKLHKRRKIKCERRDSGEEMDARLALICSDEVETEGYVLTFSPAAEIETEAEGALPPRPEFYDFDLFKREPDRKGRDVPLKELRCVAFDTETTGLQPSSGDEIISIGAVRVTNGRIVTGETFKQLVDPGMKIPKASIRFHGITDKDVKGQPDAKTVLPQFHRFCGTAALIAHNAAFDMKFLALKEKAAGVTFKNPVLDILLLSAFLHDHTGDHSLQTSAERLGIEVSDRHTALGDAITTAHIYLAMLDPLESRGIVTLGDAFKAQREQVKIRKMQAQF